MDLVPDTVDVDVELDVKLRLNLPLEHRWGAWALDRKILDVLREYRELRLGPRLDRAVTA